MKRNRILMLSGLLSVLLSGCVSYYSPALLGHDKIVMPPPDYGEEGFSQDGGLFLKISPVLGEYEDYSSLSLQAGLMHGAAFPLIGPFSLQLAGSASIYGGINSLEEYPEGSSDGENPDLIRKSFYGIAGQGDMRVLIGKRHKVTVGLEGVYDREWGDYKAYREEICEVNDDCINLSPSGQSYSLMLTEGFLYNRRNGSSFFWEAGLGLAVPDIYGNHASYDGDNINLDIWKISFLYREDNLWAWAAWESVPYMNSGLNIGTGFYLY